MRSFHAAMMAGTLVGAASCFPPPENEGTGGGGGAGGGEPTGCDASADCNSCQSCAAQGECAAAIDQCSQNPACVGIDQCFSLCGPDFECRDQCLLSNPEGVNAYGVALQCLYCDQCPTICAGSPYCTG